jgi:hypothetical protein
MDCVTFRRRLLEDPSRGDADLLTHESGCTGCAEFARRTRADEARLRAALQVAPPPELVERIQLAASFEKPERRRERHWLAAAAGVALLGVGLSAAWFLTPLERRGLSLADSVLHHVRDETHHMREVGPVPGWQLEALFAAYGARLTGELGTVNFAARCIMRKKTGIHLVLPGEAGPVTVFFMPDEFAASVDAVADSRFSGYIEPAPWGSIAVVGEAGEPLEGMAERLLSKIEWPTRYSAATAVNHAPPRA